MLTLLLLAGSLLQAPPIDRDCGAEKMVTVTAATLYQQTPARKKPKRPKAPKRQSKGPAEAATLTRSESAPSTPQIEVVRVQLAPEEATPEERVLQMQESDPTFLPASWDDEVFKRRIHYPEYERLQGFSGHITVAIRIDAEGEVVERRVVGLSGISSDMLEEAFYGIRFARYRPAKLGGVPVESLATVDIRFSLVE